MEKIKKGLGRGLSSLIGETRVAPQKNQLSISDLVPNKYQPRKIFDETSLEDFTNISLPIHSISDPDNKISIK